MLQQPCRARPVEGFIAGGHLVEVEVHLSELLCEDDV
jgi:hypothetical protein